jgi:quinolinate synthase
MDGIIEEITQLKQEQNAVILAHNYQIPEVQDIADHVGDSLELSRLASACPERVILFAGVRFMAETAKLLSPSKTVLLPEKDAGCPMAEMITPAQLLKMKEEHPGSPVVAYVNSTVEVKALTDICCTSSNAVKIVNSLPDRDIIFVPDRNLGSWVQRFTDKKLHMNKGYCIVHDALTLKNVTDMKALHPGALVLAHPECTAEVLDEADAVESTSGMLRYVAGSDRKEFIIATESGMNHRLRLLYPDRIFYPMQPDMVCRNMKKTTLSSIVNSLRQKKYEITLEPGLRNRAVRPVHRMLELP